MTYSYSGNPSLTAKDAVRFLTGDTLEEVSLLSDEEIAYLLAQSAEPAVAAQHGVRAMLAKCASDTVISADGMTRDLTGRREALAARLRELQGVRAFAVLPSAGVTAGTGDPAFTREQFDHGALSGVQR